MWLWLKRQYDDVKGNAKWALAVISWGFALQIGKYVLHQATQLPLWGIWAILGMLSLVAFVWLTKQSHPADQGQVSSPRTQTSAAALSTTAAKFDPQKFFTIAYTSPLTDEAGNNIRAVAHTYYSNSDERERFYEKFIGISVQSYTYDEIWWMIFRSQLRLLQELNQRILQIDEARAIYADAEKEFPTEYATDNFERWLSFLLDKVLLSQEGMKLAITPRGRDFLKYLVHTGRSETMRRL